MKIRPGIDLTGWALPLAIGWTFYPKTFNIDVLFLCFEFELIFKKWNLRGLPVMLRLLIGILFIVFGIILLVSSLGPNTSLFTLILFKIIAFAIFAGGAYSIKSIL